MGLYGWLNDQEFERYSSVGDKGINEALQEVRALMPEWYISERISYSKSFWGKVKTTYHYTVFHRSRPDYTEVRYQISATTRGEILNLLYGLYMGYHKAKEDETTKGQEDVS